MTKSEKQKLCAGCRSDFYNGKNSVGVKECWSFQAANVVTRYRLGWWTRPTGTDAFSKVKTLTCHHAPGQYMDYTPEQYRKQMRSLNA